MTETLSLNQALQVVKGTDLGTLTLRREQIKQEIKNLKPTLQRLYPKPQPMTEGLRQANIQKAQEQLQDLETRLHVRGVLYEKLDAFIVTLTSNERELFDEITRYYSRSGVDDYDARQAAHYRQELARLGEPEPEWVDPRVEAAQKLSVLEAALDQVNKDIREARGK